MSGVPSQRGVGGACPRSCSQGSTTSSGTRAGEIFHMISVGGWGRGRRDEPVRLVCQASRTRERLGAGIKQRAGIPSCPEFTAAGKLRGLGHPGGGQGRQEGGRQPPGQCAPPAPRGKSPREAAARALALPARRPPRGTRRRRRLPARSPGQPAARSRPSLPSRPPAASWTQRGTRGRGGRQRSRWNRKPPSGGRRLTRPLPKCGQASRDRGGRPDPSPAAVTRVVSATLRSPSPESRRAGGGGWRWGVGTGKGAHEFPDRHPWACAPCPEGLTLAGAGEGRPARGLSFRAAAPADSWLARAGGGGPGHTDARTHPTRSARQ